MPVYLHDERYASKRVDIHWRFTVDMLQHCYQVVPLQDWSGPDVSKKLKFPDFLTTAQDGGKVVSLTHRPPLHPENAPGTHFC